MADIEKEAVTPTELNSLDLDEVCNMDPDSVQGESRFAVTGCLFEAARPRPSAHSR
jgi:hypothetical protein